MIPRSIFLLAALAPAAALGGELRPVDPTGDLDEVYKARRVALLVGVDGYDDPELQSLSFAGNDAVELGAVLENQAAGGYDEVIVLTGPDETRAQDILAAISEHTAELQRNDTFLLYLSGHGTLTLDPLDGTQLWFLPSDGELNRPRQTGIGVEWLEETLHELTPRRRVLVMDTCHNGRSKSGLSPDTQAQLARLKGDPPAPAGVAEVTELEARLYAAEFHQPAMEDPDLEHGVYTHFLIESLTAERGTADLDRDGLVDVVEAHNWAMDATVRYTGGLQVPRFNMDGVGRDKIYLAGDPALRKSAENALLTAYDGLLASARLLIDGTPRGAAPGLVAVEPGRHKVEVQTEDGRTVVERRVTVRAGETRKIEDLLPRASRWTVLGGVQLIGGPGGAATVPVQPELELGWRRARGAVQPMAYARLSGSYGVIDELYVPELELDTEGWSALGSLGGGIGFGSERFVIGPQLEVGAHMRYFVWPSEQHWQPSVMVAPGLRVQGEVLAQGAGAMTVRYDVRVAPHQYDRDLTILVTHGLAVGFTFR